VTASIAYSGSVFRCWPAVRDIRSITGTPLLCQCFG